MPLIQLPRGLLRPLLLKPLQLCWETTMRITLDILKTLLETPEYTPSLAYEKYINSPAKQLAVGSFHLNVDSTLESVAKRLNTIIALNIIRGK